MLLFLTLPIFLFACSKQLHQSKTSAMKSDAPLENTRWKLSSLPGLDTLPRLEKDVWIQFVLNSPNFRGNAGCNNMTGTFAKGNDNSLKIGPVAMTRMMCPEPMMKIEQLMSKAVNETNNYQISGDHLILRKDGAVLAEFDALYLK